MGKRVKISVFFEDRVSAYYGIIVCESPLEIEFDNDWQIDRSSLILYSEVVNNIRHIFILTVKEIKEKSIVFNKKENIQDRFFKNRYIEFHHSFNIIEFGSSEEEKYRQLSDQMNLQELNSTAEKLKEVYSRDDLENRELISFLIDINAKIDEILYLLKPKINIDGTKPYNSLLISGEGILFVSSQEIKENNIMLYTTIRDSGGFFTFSSICSTSIFYKTNKYFVYAANFINMNQNIQDKIIKYIFRLERDMLKEANK